MAKSCNLVAYVAIATYGTGVSGVTAIETIGSSYYCIVFVTKCVNSFLSYDNCVTYGAVLTFGKTGSGTSRSYCCVDNLGVAEGVTLGLTAKSTGLCYCTGCFGPIMLARLNLGKRVAKYEIIKIVAAIYCGGTSCNVNRCDSVSPKRHCLVVGGYVLTVNVISNGNSVVINKLDTYNNVKPAGPLILTEINVSNCFIAETCDLSCGSISCQYGMNLEDRCRRILPAVILSVGITPITGTTLSVDLELNTAVNGCVRVRVNLK